MFSTPCSYSRSLCLLKAGLVGISLGIAIALPARSEPCSAIAPLPEISDRPSLVPGDRGADVRSLQTLLTLLGYYDGAIDGVFNDQLTSSVQRFQTSADLPPSGQVTNETWKRLLPPRVSEGTCVEAS